MALRTDYKDYILDTSVNTQRKYRMVTNDDGTVSFVDETVYTQNGDTFGASEVNKIHAAVNLVNDSLNVRYNEETDTIQIYFNGEWVDWKDANLQATYIYKNGVVNVPLVAVGTLGSSGSSTFDTNVITIKSVSSKGSGRRQAVRTTGTLSLTNVNRLYVDYSTELGNGTLFVTISSTAVDNPYGSGTIVKTQRLVTDEAHSVLEVDLSTYSGSYYVYIGVLTDDTTDGLTSITSIHTISYK